MANYISQTFSVKSLKLLSYNAKLKITKINKSDVPKDCISYIGHKNNAFFINKLLKTRYQVNHSSNTFTPNDVLYIVLNKDETLTIKQHKDISDDELENKLVCLKVTFQGLKVESGFTRLIRQASNYLTRHFTFKFLGTIDYEAELMVIQIDKSQIPKTDIKTYISDNTQKQFLQQELGMSISSKHSKTWMVQDGDVFYIATTDDGRMPEGGTQLDINYYQQHSIYLKIEVHGIDAVQIIDNE